MKKVVKKLLTATIALTLLGTCSAANALAYSCKPSDPHPHGYHLEYGTRTRYGYANEGNKKNYWRVTYTERICSCCGGFYDYHETSRKCIW